MKIKRKPWGVSRRFVDEKKCKVNILKIKPHQETSYHNHKNLIEKFYFVTPGYIKIENKKRKFNGGETFIVKKRQKHKIFAKKNEVIVFEVVLGTFNESDKVIFEDKYGRK
jgi:mannose-6-phosphate isomerase-like protein (cupin superfamily)